MSKVVIDSVRERTRITKEGEFERYNEVTYLVDDARHHLELPITGFNAKIAEEAVKAAAAEFAAVTGKTIQVSKPG